MKRRITIAAVGDILMWKEQVASAKAAGSDSYSFSDMFAPISPFLQHADLAIGNLETTFSGKAQPHQIGSARTGYPRFNCPDELAPALKQAGFHVLTTANNHCLDGGVDGLMRTLDVLDRYGLEHTGTYRFAQEASTFLVKDVHGIRVGILSYTYGTNKQTIPADRPWLVNTIEADKIEQDIVTLRNQADLVMVCLHFGIEFRHTPTMNQRLLVQRLLEKGADVILGAHPHVLQPVVTPLIVSADGMKRKTVVAYSLGNFTSERMLRFDQSLCGAILQVTVEKDGANRAMITQVSVTPTYSQRYVAGGRIRFRVLPLRAYLRNPDKHLPPLLRKRLRLLKDRAVHIIGRRFV